MSRTKRGVRPPRFAMPPNGRPPRSGSRRLSRRPQFAKPRNGTPLNCGRPSCRCRVTWAGWPRMSRKASLSRPCRRPGPRDRPPARPGRTAKPAARPAKPAARPAKPAARPAKPTGKAAGRPRQYFAMRLSRLAVAAMVLFAVTAGSTEIALHGFSFFVFRAAGTGSTPDSGLKEDQGPGQPDAPGTHRHVTVTQHKPRKHHHHHPGAHQNN